MANLHQNAREIFQACRRAATSMEREEIMDRECGDDALLRERVEKLLLAREGNGNNLLQEVVSERGDGQDATPSTTQKFDPAVFDRGGSEGRESPNGGIVVSEHPLIGPYKLLQQIGEGGFGVVYMAEQTEPVRRKVALKVIKAGMDTKEVIARFEAERQALALMDHPHMARVLDAGTTENGRPYFVMELVHGTPITTFCDKAKLSTQQRLELFADVCRAVQHAHLKGIIHRDLKPSNVLVTMNDDKPLPKVIDFGVAKALSSPLTEKTLFTAYGQMVGTPLYMSPEQAQLSAHDVDVRSDIYSLGVMLYELLTGSTPFDKETLKKSGFDEMRRLILEVDPPRPSVRVSTLEGQQVSTVSARQRIDAKKFSQSLKGELDWIVMKALEKDRDRRYESASALVQDLERYLNNEPVQACPLSWRYYLKKQINRHRGVVASALLLLVAVLVGVAFSIWYAIQADDARRLADIRLEDAEVERAKAETANQRFGELLYAADMKLASDAIANGDIPRAVELLDRHRLKVDAPDARGFEWSFFKKQTTQLPQHSIELNVRVHDVALSPDGNSLAVGMNGGFLRVYEVDRWRESHSFLTLSESIGGVAWSPDGQSLAGACSNGNVAIWDARTGKTRITIPAHVGGANDVVFAKDGQSLFSCGEDNLAKQWIVESGDLKQEFKSHKHAVERIALSPDGKRLATASRDDTFAVWETETAKKLYQSQNDGGHIVCVAFATDGRVAAGDILGHVSIYDHETGDEWQLPRQLDGVESLTFFKNGKWLATADRGGAIQLHALDRDHENPDDRLPILGEPLRWIAHKGRALTVSATADGERLITGGRDGGVRVWAPDIQAHRWCAFSDHDTTGFAVASNDRFYVTGRCISAWDIKQRRQIDSFPPANPHWEHLAASDDGRWLAAVRREELALLNGQTHEKIQSWPLPNELDPHRLAMSPDGQQIAVCGHGDEAVHLFSRDSKEIRKYAASQCNALAFSPDCRWLAAGHMDDLRLFDLNTPAPFRILKGHANSLAAASFSPDGKKIATVSHDRLLKIWSFPDGREESSIVAHQDRVRAVVFSPDGRTIATAGDTGQVKFWHTATGQPLGALPPEGTSFRDLKFTPDGRRLIGMLQRAKFVIYDGSPAVRPLDSSPHRQSKTEFHGLRDLPGGPEYSYVNGLSWDGTVVFGHGHSHGGFEHVVWQRPRQLGAGPWHAEIRQGGEKAKVPGPSGENTVLAGHRWEQGHWRAYRFHAGKTVYLSPAPDYSNAEAAGITADGRVVLGHVYNIHHVPAKKRLLVSQHMKDVRPVIWAENGLEFLKGFDKDQQWWAEDISDDGNVIVGVSWTPGKNFFSPVDYRSGVAFRWEAGEVELLGSLANHQHSQAFAVSGDGRVVVGACFYRTPSSQVSETGFLWDAHHGMRSLAEVLAKAGADIKGWEIYRGVAISSDGTTIAGNGINPNGKKEGWVAQFPEGFFGAPQDNLKQPAETTMNDPP